MSSNCCCGGSATSCTSDFAVRSCMPGASRTTKTPLRLRTTLSLPASTTKSLSTDVPVTALTMRNAPRMRRSLTSSMAVGHLTLVQQPRSHCRSFGFTLGLKTNGAGGVSNAEPVFGRQRVPHAHDVFNAQVGSDKLNILVRGPVGRSRKQDGTVQNGIELQLAHGPGHDDLLVFGAASPVGEQVM